MTARRQVIRRTLGLRALRACGRSAIADHPGACLAVLVLLALAVHVLLALFWSFGEADSARLANDALKGFLSGSLHDLESNAYSTPLYLDGLRHALGWGLLSARTLPLAMTFLSFGASAAVSVALFLIVRPLARSAAIALVAALLLQFNPAFFVFSIYGFPTILAGAFFLWSFVVFERALRHRAGWSRYLLLLLSLLLYLAAVLTKVDMLLASALFCLPVWLAPRSRKSKVALTGLLVLAALISFGLFNLYAAHLVPATGPGSAWSTHFTRFFGGAGALGQTSTWWPLIRGAGLLTIPLAVLALGLTAVRREGRTVALWMVLAALPLVLYWALLRGNSARHNLLPVVFLYVLLVLPLTARRKWIWAMLLAVMLIGNYFAFVPSRSTIEPSGRLVESARLIKARAADLHAGARAIAARPDDRLAVLGNGAFHPYITFEILRNQGYVRHAGIDAPGNPQELITRRGTRETFYYLDYFAPGIPRMLSLAEQGYFLVIADGGALVDAAMTPALLGRYASRDTVLAGAGVNLGP